MKLRAIAADQALQAAQGAVPPPGVTIAGNVPGLPLVYANGAFTELTRYPIGDVLGRNCRFLQGSDRDPKDITALAPVGRTTAAGSDCATRRKGTAA